MRVLHRPPSSPATRRCSPAERAGDVCGAWAIAEYLEEAYPDPPP